MNLWITHVQVVPNLSGFASVELLRDQAEHCDRAHKQDSIVELILISDWSDDTSAIGHARTALLDTSLSSSSVRASMNSLLKLGKLA